MRDLPAGEIRAVFSDLDDTLTDHGRIDAATYEALWKLKDAGLAVVLVSGRPAGWADCLIRLWPLDAVIFENGAGLFLRDASGVRAENLVPLPAAAQRARLDQIFQTLKKKIPELKLAKDQPYRLYDYAIDFGEDPPFLPEARIAEVLDQLAAEKGITAKLSSIHVNYWCGTHTKVTACEHWLRTYGAPLGIARESVAFCGDSPNDEPLFAYFPHSVGVANLTRFLAKLKNPPRYLASKAGGAGFRELVEKLLGR